MMSKRQKTRSIWQVFRPTIVVVPEMKHVIKTPLTTCPYHVAHGLAPATTSEQIRQQVQRDLERTRIGRVSTFLREKAKARSLRTRLFQSAVVFFILFNIVLTTMWSKDLSEVAQDQEALVSGVAKSYFLQGKQFFNRFLSQQSIDSYMLRRVGLDT